MFLVRPRGKVVDDLPTHDNGRVRRQPARTAFRVSVHRPLTSVLAEPGPPPPPIHHCGSPLCQEGMPSSSIVIMSGKTRVPEL